MKRFILYYGHKGLRKYCSKSGFNTYSRNITAYKGCKGKARFKLYVYEGPVPLHMQADGRKLRIRKHNKVCNRFIFIQVYTDLLASIYFCMAFTESLLITCSIWHASLSAISLSTFKTSIKNFCMI